MTADKKGTITRKGVKKQIRFINDDFKTLHAKYLSENNTISYSLFCKLRTFWVLKPKEKDRKTCLCKIHDNISFKLNAAYSDGIIHTKDLDTLLKTIVCEETKNECMYRECVICSKKEIPMIMKNEDKQHGLSGKQRGRK